MANFLSKLAPKFQRSFDSWIALFSGIFHVGVILPIAVASLALYYANMQGIDQSLRLALQIVASFTAAFAGAGFRNAWNEHYGNTILLKKGQSAVRNLSLARRSAKNIAQRLTLGASQEEVKNLVVLLEDDIANAVQEWNDIIPGIQEIENSFLRMSETQMELEKTLREKEELESEIQERDQREKEHQQVLNELKDQLQVTLNKAKEEALHKKLQDNRHRRLTLEDELARASLVNSTTTSAATSSFNRYVNIAAPYQKQCPLCGRFYNPGIDDSGSCPYCDNG